jgi:hypothetical protein
LVRKIEQRRDMPTCDNATLANFELPRIDHGECMFAFIYDRPSFFATCHPFTKVARISYGKFDQLSSPIQPAGRRKTLVESDLGHNPTSVARPRAMPSNNQAQRRKQAGAANSRLMTKLSGKVKLAWFLRMQKV